MLCMFFFLDIIYNFYYYSQFSFFVDAFSSPEKLFIICSSLTQDFLMIQPIRLQFVRQNRDTTVWQKASHQNEESYDLKVYNNDHTVSTTTTLNSHPMTSLAVSPSTSCKVNDFENGAKSSINSSLITKFNESDKLITWNATKESKTSFF